MTTKQAPDRATVCLRCWERKKRDKYQFCSKQCTDIAANEAPKLLRVPMAHVMYKDVANSFQTSWKSTTPCPEISRIYLITWTRELRLSFDTYREKVAQRIQGSQKPKEVKRFRSETRFCRLGDPDASRELCKLPTCRLCRAIETGFQSSLDYKRQLISQGVTNSSRFGGGIYMTPMSAKAYKYAINEGVGNQQYRAMLATRVVLGKSQLVKLDDWQRTSPDKGYDSVEAHPVDGGPTELVVFNATAVQPAYLIILKV